MLLIISFKLDVGTVIREKYFKQRLKHFPNNQSYIKACAKNKQQNKNGQPTGIAMLPYQNATSYQISRLVAKCDFKNIHVPV